MKEVKEVGHDSPYKPKRKGYGGPKNLVLHKEGHHADRGAGGRKSTGNEHWHPKQPADLPVTGKLSDSSPSGGYHADPTPEGSRKGQLLLKPKAGEQGKGILADKPSDIAQHRLGITAARKAFTNKAPENLGEY